MYMLIIAAIMLLRKDAFENTLKEMISLRALLYLLGVFNLLFGLAIVIAHPIWELNWRGFITLLGCLSLIKGVVRLAFPKEDQRFVKSLMQGNAYWIVLGGIALIGLYLAYEGFFKDHLVFFKKTSDILILRKMKHRL
ncbi:MAG: hypothetical protein HWD61_12740 [Parachlamydiaceae bacterium]|nr:MAG: hypothetical protein HWD61_12740 [Parachlamydiaceae bacterium]